MKTLFVTMFVLFSMAVFAQSEKVIENAPDNYLHALKSDNTGVVESAIFHSLKFKIFYPEQNTEKLDREFSKLIKEGKTASIRYKAFLVNQCINCEDLLTKIEKENYKDADKFFTLLAQKVNDYLLAAN
jgi:hypothetical protein